MNLRNVAIIAHVDHGKTTLVDGLLKQSKTFRENEAFMSQDLILDSNEQERERGITILAKNTAVNYKDIKINIIDTPGHADFSGEVERTLNMADGALLLVDAQEGPMPQTKFVLRKALELGLKIIVVINKIDKKDSRIKDVIDEISNLFLDLATDTKHLEFPVIYAVGRDGKAWKDLPSDLSEAADLTPIFDAIIEYIPEPQVEENGSFQLLVSSLDWDNYKGKYVIGRVHRGKVKAGDEIVLIKPDEPNKKATIEKIYVNEGLKRIEVENAETGDIIAITGIKNAEIGDTIADTKNPEALKTIKISEPTLSVSISANTSPFKGTEGTQLTNLKIQKRIEDELQTNVAMRFIIDDSGRMIISGRGELHLCVFLETLSREGFEIEIGKPQVITKEIDGIKMEPIEEFSIDVPTEYVGSITGEFGKRGGIMKSHHSISSSTARMVFDISTRNALGLRSVLLSLSKGTAVVSATFSKYEKVAPSFDKRYRRGVIIALDKGKATEYALNNAQDRGQLFVTPGTLIYPGMIVGTNPRDTDIELNVCKEKHLTNMRSKGEDSIFLNAESKMTLEQCFGFIENDELLEITPQNLRLRKKILDPLERKRAERKKVE